MLSGASSWLSCKISQHREQTSSDLKTSGEAATPEVPPLGRVGQKDPRQPGLPRKIPSQNKPTEGLPLDPQLPLDPPTSQWQHPDGEQIKQGSMHSFSCSYSLNIISIFLLLIFLLHPLATSLVILTDSGCISISQAGLPVPCDPLSTYGLPVGLSMTILQSLPSHRSYPSTHL